MDRNCTPSSVGVTPEEVRRKMRMPSSSSMDLMIADRVVCPMYRRLAAAEIDLLLAISRR